MITVQQIGQFLLRTFIGVVACIAVILINIFAWLLYVPDILRAVFDTAIWVFAIYCFGSVLYDLLSKLKDKSKETV